MKIMGGAVYLVGAGPGDPGLITVSGLAVVKRADVLVHDRLVADELIGEVRSTCEVINAGKAPGQHRYAQSWINALIVDRAKHGRVVARLKGGDPFMFGRGYEELSACQASGVPCVVIPGVSSALAGPAAAGIPVTQRGGGRSVAVITAQVAAETNSEPLNFHALAAMDTLVILMGRANLAEVTASLVAAGRDPETPAACIERATTSAQRAIVSTLSSLSSCVDKEGLSAPVVTVIGEVAALARDTQYGAIGPILDAVVPFPRAI